ncbi:TRAP transporter substrate-binding protein [Hoeflea poritis]|uniref:TRAP transporter substrate-binding protein n=1 Tax=Hoeflea poritis TaxID=2993659 RepID=A0ABT4VJX5_9HYPH|nr:TRAP transporter substrate-binding protein [Hoeflea poritis]MDA4844455.1 TRAP transporter substrate-binding protein [Hoeflea poritis]
MAAIPLKFGGYQGPASVHTRGGHVFGNALSEELGGSIDFSFDSNIVERGQKASDLLSMVESGTLDACYFSSSYLASRVPELGIFDQHFIVPDRTRAYAVLDGALGLELAGLMQEKTGFAVLDFWDNGFRHISNGKGPLLAPQDCAGLQIRTLANDNHQRVFRALGFEPKTIDVRDLPAAVADGTVDAQENPLTNIYNFGLHKHHKHITLTRHLIGVAMVLFNKDAVNAWPSDFREGVQRALRKATLAQRGFAEEDDVVCAEKLIAEGVEISELGGDQRRAFVDATADEVAKTRAQFDARLIGLFDEDLAGR